jgi:hypothetical protein
MSTCNPETLMADGKCFYCLGAKEKAALRLQLLCEIKNSIGAVAAAATPPTVAAIAYAASIDVDLDGADYQTIALTGDLDLNATLNRPAAGFAKSVALIVAADGSDRNITYNANWTPIGTDPASVTANKTAVISITALGPNETDVLIVIQEQP